MQLDEFYSTDGERFFFSREQASRFAKHIAGDFNPIHDPDSKRFCVPGDLVFALVLARYGLCRHMAFRFTSMVDDQARLSLVETAPGQLSVQDQNGKECLGVTCEGEKIGTAEQIAELTRRYVEFSGQTFPHILVPLMQARQVMINPQRPMVIYHSMIIDLDTPEFRDPELKMTETRLDVEGKRGHARLCFELHDGDRLIGRGEKNMILSGLRPYDQAGIDHLIGEHTRHKAAYVG